MTCRSTWIFLVGAIGAATLFAMWSMPPSKPPVLLQKEGDDSETPQNDSSAEKEAVAGQGATQEPAEPTSVLYRRYHHWNSPNSGGLPADSLEKCESACSGDSSCFGVTFDGNMQTCAKLPKGNFNPTSGLLGGVYGGHSNHIDEGQKLEGRPLGLLRPLQARRGSEPFAPNLLPPQQGSGGQLVFS